MNVRITLLTMLLFAVACVSNVNADEISDIKQQVQQLQQRLEQLEAEKQQQSEEIDKKISEAVKEKEVSALPDNLKWIENFKLFGDLRYRHEYTDDDTASQSRHRHRLRARVGLTGKVNDQVNATVALASGSSESATNTNQELTGAFSSKNIWLDLAYFDIHPEKVKGLNIHGGKIKNPYGKVGNSDLMYDTDVRPEGIAAIYKKTLSENTNLLGVFGGYWLQERGADVDTGLWAGQVTLTHKIPDIEDCSVTAGAGYFNYTNIENQVALGTSAVNFRGNTNSGGVYATDFDIMRTFGQVSFSVSDQPCMVFGEMLMNTSANSNEDTGYLVGAGVGKCKNPGSWQAVYNYRDLQADCTPAALADSTIAGGGTKLRGHKISVGYQLAKNWNLSANYLVGDRIRTNKTDHKVFQFDINYKF